MSKMKTNFLKACSLASVLVAAGCGYSDYPGHPGHKTQNEAYVPSLSAVVAGFGDDYDGTYVYSVKYNNRNWMSDDFQFNAKISSYRNVVTDSYPHRPDIFPDADDFEKATGFAGGEFTKYWVANDMDPNVAGGLDNFDKTHPLDADGNWIEPGLVLSVDEPIQEVDRVDWDLQTSAQSATQILKAMVSNGGKIDDLNLKIKALEFNGRSYPTDYFSLGFKANGSGFNQVTIKNQKSTKSLINTILTNTEHMKKTSLKLHFDNGMVVGLPHGMSIMFNHTVLAKFAK